jgi:predicted cation transporter
MTDSSGLYFYCALIFVIAIGAFAIFINLAFLIRKYRDTRRFLYPYRPDFTVLCLRLLRVFLSIRQLNVIGNIVCAIICTGQWYFS